MAPKKRSEYEITGDSAGIFSTGEIIPDSKYDSLKEDYDIRLKDWDDGTLQVSGRKRDLIKGFLEEKRFAITSEYYHYQVRARGKNMDPAPILLKIRELGMKFLWVRVIGEKSPDGNPKK
jgi:hypothetical protein